MTCVVNKKRGDPYDVYIGRGSPFGNPYRIGPDGTREEVIEKYRVYFHDRLRSDPAFASQVDQLHGKRLGCFCAPAPCHGDCLVEYLDGPASEPEPPDFGFGEPIF